MINYKSGYVSILGLPNTGKSTLVNTLLNKNISIVTKKKQTTINRISGILESKNFQIIISDTPGFMKPKNELQKIMIKNIKYSIKNSDILIYLLNNNISYNQKIIKIIKKYNKPIIFVLNKIDVLTYNKINNILNYYIEITNNQKIIKISALKNLNLNILINKIHNLIPSRLPYFNNYKISKNDNIFFITEIIRKEIFLLYNQEIPYETCIKFIHVKKENMSYELFFNIIVEKNSQKKIISGNRYQRLNKLQNICKKKLQIFYKKTIKVYFLLKNKKNWRNTDYYIINNYRNIIL